MALEKFHPGVDQARFAKCRKAIDGFLDEQLTELVECARQSVLVAARDASEREEEERLLLVLEEIESLCPQACDAFRLALQSTLISGDAIDESIGMAGQGSRTGGGSLDLVETAMQDEWVWLRRLLGRQTEQEREDEQNVWQHVASVGGLEVYPDECPVSLQGVCLLFQGAMSDLSPGRFARKAIYDAFESTVVLAHTVLITELDTLLDSDETDEEELFADDDPTYYSAPPTIGGIAASALATDSAVDSAPRAATVSTLASTSAAAMESTNSALAVPGAAIDPSRLLGVLARVQRGLGSAPAGDVFDCDDLEAKLTATVASADAGLDDKATQAVGVVAQFVRELVANPAVEADLKRRLWRLAPPLLTLALQDDDYLESELAAARHDPLTGLHDAAALRDRLESALRRSAQSGSRPALCVANVDDFRALTQRFGYQVGGRILRGLGTLLQRQGGASTIVARIHRGEFAVALFEAREDSAQRFAERYLEAVRAARFVFDGENVRLGVSVGVVESDAKLATFEDMMQAADSARRAAQAAGGNGFSVYDPT